MHNLVDEKIILNFNEIDNYDFPLNKLLLITINYNTIQFDFIAYFRDNPNLLCLGTGSQSPNRRTKDGKLVRPPFFHGWSWYDSFEENFLVYSDPTHYFSDKIHLGWYVGDRDTWYLEVISNIVKKFAVNRKIANNNILFYGSSGGGFAAIELATLNRGSNVLVNNAQFFVMNYQSWGVNRLFELLSQYFPSYDRDEIYQEIKHRLNLIELFKKMKYVPNIHYYVNVNSKEDINNQCIPFLKKIVDMDYFTDDFDIHFYHDNHGHDPLVKEKSVEIIKNFSKTLLYNDNSIKLGSFKVDIPIGFYPKSENSISDGNTTIILHDIQGDDVQNHIDKYVNIKRTKYNREVNVSCLNIPNEIWKATIVNNADYANYWFEKDNQMFHFHTSSACENLDDIITEMAESLSRI